MSWELVPASPSISTTVRMCKDPLSVTLIAKVSRIETYYFVSKNRYLTDFRYSKNFQVACEGVASSGIRA